MLFMLRETRRLVEKRKDRRGRRRLYAPRIQWRKWLSTGDQDEEALPTAGRKAARQGHSNTSTDDTNEYHDEEEKTLLKKKKNPNDEEKAAGISGTRYGLLDNREVSSTRIRVPNLEAVSQDGRKIDGQPRQSLPSSNAKEPIQKARALTDSFINWGRDSEDVAYALKVTLASMLVLWPAFVPDLNVWYYNSRGGKQLSLT